MKKIDDDLGGTTLNIILKFPKPVEKIENDDEFEEWEEVV